MRFNQLTFRNMFSVSSVFLLATLLGTAGNAYAEGEFTDLHEQAVHDCYTPTHPASINLPVMQCGAGRLLTLNIEWGADGAEAVMGYPTLKMCGTTGCDWLPGFQDMSLPNEPPYGSPGIHRFFTTCTGEGHVTIYTPVLSSVQGNSCYTIKVNY